MSGDVTKRAVGRVAVAATIVAMLLAGCERRTEWYMVRQCGGHEDWRHTTGALWQHDGKLYVAATWEPDAETDSVHPVLPGHEDEACPRVR